MTSALGLAAILLAGFLPGSRPAVAKPPRAAVLRFVAPGQGPEATRAGEFLAGARAALTEDAESGPVPSLEEAALPADPGRFAKHFASLVKAKVDLAIVWAPDGQTAAVERAATKVRLPVLVVSPEPTRPDLDRKRAVFWAGGLRPDDAALPTMDFLLQPLGSNDPTLLHDGSARGRLMASKCRRLHHVSQRPKEPVEVGADFDGARATELAGAGTDAFAYFGGPAGAERLLTAVKEAGIEVPVLLGQGLVSAAVPSFRDGSAANAWAVGAAWMEDFEGPGVEALFPLREAAKAAAGGRVLPQMVRGFRVLRWVRQALAQVADPVPKKLVPALRKVARKSAQGKPVFEPWGHASLARLQGWRAAAVRDDPVCHRVNPLLLPMEDTPQVGFFSASKYQWEPDTLYVYVSWQGAGKRTIEKDLQALGLHTQGYEADLEKRVLDDLLGRVMGRLNRLFLRNVDGTAIPGVSYAISFTAEPPPKSVKGARVWNVRISGDHPFAGGQASGNDAFVFSTFIQRTMYVRMKLDPPLSASDRPFVAGTYDWGETVPKNLRDGLVRALVDGYSQGMALTGAHELGHVSGCGHDTQTPRSIMNVQEGAGLEFAWAHWVPAHDTILAKRLGRVPADPKRRRR